MSTSSINSDLYYKKCLFREGNSSDITLYKYHDAPTFLRENSYIIHGYRPVLSIRYCLKSIFLWTNETLNIWSHLLGFILCFVLMIYHLLFTTINIGLVDKMVLCLGLICVQICLLCSTGYHIFKCHSAESYRKWLNVDFFGISLGFIGCFSPAFHLAFYCFKNWYAFYMFIITLVFFIFVCWHSCTWRKCSSFNNNNTNTNLINNNNTNLINNRIDDKMTVGVLNNKNMALHDNTRCLVAPVFFYGSIFLAGLVPALHWFHLSGGFNSNVTQIFIPKLVVLYILMFAAFLFYLTKFPECCFPGRFDFIGSSHQCWHVLIVVAYLWWYKSGYQFLEYILEKRC